MPPKRAQKRSRETQDNSSSPQTKQNISPKKGRGKAARRPSNESSPPANTVPSAAASCSAEALKMQQDSSSGTPISDHLNRLLESLSKSSSILLQLELGEEIAEFVFHRSKQPVSDRRHVFQFLVNESRSTEWDRRRGASALASTLAGGWKNKYHGGLEDLLERVDDAENSSQFQWNNLKLDMLEANKIATKGERLLAFDEEVLSKEIDEANARRSESYSNEQLSKIMQWKILEAVGQGENTKVVDGVKYGEAHKIADYQDVLESQEVREQRLQRIRKASRERKLDAQSSQQNPSKKTKQKGTGSKGKSQRFLSPVLVTESLHKQLHTDDGLLHSVLLQASVGLYDHRWECRHGSCMVLNELLYSLLFEEGDPSSREHRKAASLASRSLAFCEDILMRSISLLLLDKFGDYSSGRVIAPVRQSSARLLSTVCHCATQEMTQQIVEVLTQLFSKTDWHGRHGILLSLRELFQSNPSHVKESFSRSNVNDVLERILDDPVEDVQYTGVEVLNTILEDNTLHLPQTLLLAFMRLALRSSSSEVSCSAAVESILPALNSVCVYTLRSTKSGVDHLQFTSLVLIILHRLLNFSKGQRQYILLACKLIATITRWVRETHVTEDGDNSSLADVVSLLVDCSLSAVLMSTSIDETAKHQSLESFFDVRDLLLGLPRSISGFIAVFTIYKWYHLLLYDRGELFFVDTWDIEQERAPTAQWPSIQKKISAEWKEITSLRNMSTQVTPTFLYQKIEKLESFFICDRIDGDDLEGDSLSDIDVDDELVDADILANPNSKSRGATNASSLLEDFLYGGSSASRAKLSDVLKESSQNFSRAFFEADKNRQETLCLALASLGSSKLQQAHQFLTLKVIQGCASNYSTLAVNSLIVWMFVLAVQGSRVGRALFELGIENISWTKEMGYLRNVSAVENTCSGNTSDTVVRILREILRGKVLEASTWLAREPQDFFMTESSMPVVNSLPVECKGSFSNFLLCFDAFLQAADTSENQRQQHKTDRMPEWLRGLPFIDVQLVLSLLPCSGFLLTQELPVGSRTPRAEEEAKMQQQRGFQTMCQSIRQIQSKLADFILTGRVVLGDSGLCSSHMAQLHIPYSYFYRREDGILNRIYWSLMYHQFGAEEIQTEVHSLLKAVWKSWRCASDDCISNMDRMSTGALKWENPLVLQHYDDLQDSYRRGAFQLISSTLLTRQDTQSIQNWVTSLMYADTTSNTIDSVFTGEIKQLLETENSGMFCTAFSVSYALALFMAVGASIESDNLSEYFLQILDTLYPLVTKFGAIPASVKNVSDAYDQRGAILSSALYDALTDVLAKILSKAGNKDPILIERVLNLSLVSGQNRSIAGSTLCSKVITLLDSSVSYPLSSLLLRKALRCRSEVSSVRETLAIANCNSGVLFRLATEDCVQVDLPNWCAEEQKRRDLCQERTSIKSFYLLQNDTVNQLDNANGERLQKVLRGVDLRQYQIEGIAWLLFLSNWGLNGCLADDMGLGKTLQALAAVSILAQQRKEKSVEYRCLIVCPASIVHHWSYEAEQYFGFPWFRCEHYYGARNRRKKALDDFASPIGGSAVSALVCSYGVLVKDISILEQIQWDCCILDEAHVISNPSTKIATCMKQLQASNRIALTGTPIQNSLSDLWSIFDFLMPGYLGDQKLFRKNFEKPVSNARNSAKDESQLQAANVALRKLHYQMKGLVLRRTKEQVLDELPPKVIQDVTVELSQKQRELYRKYCNEEMVADLRQAHQNRKSQEKTSEGTMFSNLRKLQYICNDASLGLDTSSEHSNSYVSTDIGTSSKLQALEDIIQNACLGRQPAIYASHVESDNDIKASRKKAKGGTSSLAWKDVGSGLETDNLVHSRIAREAVKSTLVTTSKTSTSAKEEETPVQKLLIFSRFPAMLNEVEKKLLKQYFPTVKYMRIDGSTPVVYRQERAREFNNDPDIKLMLLTTGVGNLGLNLASANIVVFIDHSWNPFNDLQAMDRAHRLGQKQTVFVNRLIAKDTIEEEIMNVQEFKKLISASVITADEENPSAVSASALAPEQQ